MNNSYKDIRKHVDSIRLIDTHEHLPPESERVNKIVDVLSQFYLHYTSSDLISAGMSMEDLIYIKDTKIPLDYRWAVFEPLWEKIKNTGYSRCMEIAARDLYGVDGINSETYKQLSRKMMDRNREGLYKWVLKEKAGIDICILDTLTHDYQVDSDLFVPVLRVSEYTSPINKKDLELLGKQFGNPIHNLGDYINLVKGRFDALKGKVAAVKIALAYNRSLHFEKRTYSEAEESLNKMYKTKGFHRVPIADTEYSETILDGPGKEELLPLQDYLVHLTIQEASRRGLPIQIHTGLHEGNQNIVSNSNPELLVNLFLEYGDAKFDIFHGSWPYSSRLSALAKNFQNVYIDMCWMHIISPSRARSALDEWLDEVPVNKIMGFGGDYLCVEGSYGHSVMARENVAKVLARKVDDGIYDIDEAKKYATWILRDNPKNLFFPEK
ncbi:MAG: amidohydrolase family protein [Candidatus Bathyarchaeota archaeon]